MLSGVAKEEGTIDRCTHFDLLLRIYFLHRQDREKSDWAFYDSGKSFLILRDCVKLRVAGTSCACNSRFKKAFKTERDRRQRYFCLSVYQSQCDRSMSGGKVDATTSSPRNVSTRRPSNVCRTNGYQVDQESGSRPSPRTKEISSSLLLLRTVLNFHRITNTHTDCPIMAEVTDKMKDMKLADGGGT